MQVKQLKTADPTDSPEDPNYHRFARTLIPMQRSAIYWDDAELLKELVVRPVPPGEEGEWSWSGSFPIPENEWYFGLRIRHATNQQRSMNIPVNVTVGSSGAQCACVWGRRGGGEGTFN